MCLSFDTSPSFFFAPSKEIISKAAAASCRK